MPSNLKNTGNNPPTFGEQDRREAVILTDDQFIVTAWNKEAEQLYGWTASEVSGQELGKILRSVFQDGERQEMLHELQDKGVFRAELLQNTRSGHPIPVEMTINALQSCDGAQCSYVCVIRKSADQKDEAADFQQKVQELEQAKKSADARAAEHFSDAQNLKARLESVLNALPVAVWIADSQGQIVQKNDMVDLIWGAEAPLSADLEDYGRYLGYWADNGEEIKAEEWGLARAITKGEISISEVIDIIRFDGLPGTILNSAAPFYDEEGNLIGAVAVAQDITQQRQYEQQAQSAAKEARQAAELLEAVFNSMVDAVTVFDAEGKLLSANQVAIEVLGFEPVGHSAIDLMDKFTYQIPDGKTIPHDQLPITLALRGETVLDRRVGFTSVEGNVYSVLASAWPLYENGSVSGVVAIWRDVTEIERLFEKNRRNEDLLQAIFEVNPGGLAVLAGENLEYQVVNPAYRELTMDPSMELVGRQYDEVWPIKEGFRVRTLIKRVLETGESIHSERHKRRYADGTVRYFSFYLYPLTWNNQPAALEVLWETSRLEFSQLSAQRRTEELAMERARLQSIIENVPAGILLTDVDGNFTQINPTTQKIMKGKLNGTSYGPVSGYTLLHPDGSSFPSSELPLPLAIERGEASQNVELLVKFDDGNETFLLVNSAPIFGSDNDIAGAISAFSDITELVHTRQTLSEYAEKLERSNRDLEDFASIASHDLQEPLRKIQAFGERLTKILADRLTREETDYLNRMLSASTRMSKMLHDLLVYSRVSSRAQQHEIVDLRKIAEEALSNLEVRIERTGGKVKLGKLPKIEAEPFQMRQLLQNLIGNALKFHQPDDPPIVQVSSRVVKQQRMEEKCVQIVIEDNGIGFDEKHLEAIFQPFQRLHGRTSYEGSGMGLAICRKIVERHGGSITATSSPGKGSSFIVTLPVRQSIEE